MPLNSFVLNSHLCYPAVQHLTVSAGGGGKGIQSSPRGGGGRRTGCRYYSRHCRIDIQIIIPH